MGHSPATEDFIHSEGLFIHILVHGHLVGDCVLFTEYTTVGRHPQSVRGESLVDIGAGAEHVLPVGTFTQHNEHTEQKEVLHK